MQPERWTPTRDRVHHAYRWVWDSLRFAVVFWADGSAPWELVQRQAGTISGTVTHPAINDGVAIDLDSTDYASIPDNDAYNLTGPMTLVWYGQIDAAGAYRHFAGKHAGNGTSNNPFDFRTTNATPPDIYLVRANATGRRELANSSSNLPTGQDLIAAVSVPLNMEDGGDFFIDGAKFAGSLTGSHTGTGPATANTEALLIGRRPDGAVQMDGKVYYVLGAARQWTDDEHAVFAADPWGWLRPVDESPVWAFSPAAGGGATAFKPPSGLSLLGVGV